MRRFPWAKRLSLFSSGGELPAFCPAGALSAQLWGLRYLAPDSANPDQITSRCQGTA